MSDGSEDPSEHRVVMIQNHCQSHNSAHVVLGLVPVHTNVGSPR